MYVRRIRCVRSASALFPSFSFFFFFFLPILVALSSPPPPKGAMAGFPAAAARPPRAASVSRALPIAKVKRARVCALCINDGHCHHRLCIFSLLSSLFSLLSSLPLPPRPDARSHPQATRGVGVLLPLSTVLSVSLLLVLLFFRVATLIDARTGTHPMMIHQSITQTLSQKSRHTPQCLPFIHCICPASEAVQRANTEYTRVWALH